MLKHVYFAHRTVRLSIGLEDLEDLKEDFRNAFKELLSSGDKRASKL